MCNFFSFLAFKNGDFFHASDYTDHHDDLILLKNVHDSESALMHQLFYRGEFTPPTDITQVGDLSKWNLRVDENVTPDWYDEAKTRDWCETQISKMIVKDERPIVLGGCWILDGEKARIGKLIMGKIKVATNGANLDGANLYGASLDGANLSRASLDGANLSRANLSRANLSRANLNGASLDGASLSRASLDGANLNGASLDGANLSRANLDGANLDGANLSRANLSRANLDGASLDGATNVILPKGWKKLGNGIVVKDE